MSAPQRKQQRKHEVIAFTHPELKNVQDANYYVIPQKAFAELLRKHPESSDFIHKYYDPQTIYIGGAYPHERSYIAVSKLVGKQVMRRGRGASLVRVTPALEHIYHPSHVSNALSHETLHKVLHHVGEHVASKAIDRGDVFGDSPAVSPTGLINFEVMRERMIEKKAGRLRK